MYYATFEHQRLHNCMLTLRKHDNSVQIMNSTYELAPTLTHLGVLGTGFDLASALCQSLWVTKVLQRQLDSALF
jgi:hypothetical protein